MRSFVVACLVAAAIAVGFRRRSRCFGAAIIIGRLRGRQREALALCRQSRRLRRAESTLSLELLAGPKDPSRDRKKRRLA